MRPIHSNDRYGYYFRFPGNKNKHYYEEGDSLDRFRAYNKAKFNKKFIHEDCKIRRILTYLKKRVKQKYEQIT